MARGGPRTYEMREAPGAARPLPTRGWPGYKNFLMSSEWQVSLNYGCRIFIIQLPVLHAKMKKW